MSSAERDKGEGLPETLSEKTSGLHRPAGAKELPQSAFHAREGATIGDFRLTRLLGRGGMGEVWEAEQTSLSRKVALKLMLPDRVSERGLDFFAREARAGGRLAHKGIVSVFGTGEDDGAHWIAMELVDGACDLKRSLDAMRDEAEVPEGYYEHTAGFIAELADALEVAHQAGVIHRDLKPANILVAADDSPKVSDFGLAKLEDELSISSAGELLGTYYYMSPEQVATKRAGIDHRTDVFSLGVVMYEMTTLVRPFEGDTTEQVAQKILWEEAPDPKAVRSRVPRDLAVICGKAMEKDPGRRYQSMAELAEDLRRYLGDEPIQAKPPAAAQRVIKWTRRNPTKSALVAAGVAGLAVFGGLWQRAETARAGEALARQGAEERRLEAEELRAQADESARMAEDARGEAVRKTAELERVANFQAERLASLDATEMGWGLRSGVLSGAHAAALREGGTDGEAARRELELRALLAGADFTGLAQDVIEEHLLEQAVAAIEGLGDLPLVEARLLSSIADTALGIGLPQRAEAPQSQALAVYREALGESVIQTVEAASNLGVIVAEQGRFEEGLTLMEEAAEAARSGGVEDQEFWVKLKLNIATCLTGLDRIEEARATTDEALAICEAALGEGHEQTLRAVELDAWIAARGRDLNSAAASFQRALAIRRQSEELGHQESLSCMNNLSYCLTELGQLEDASAITQEALALSREHLGGDHPTTLYILGTWGHLLLARGEVEAAEAVMRERLETCRDTLGEDHLDTLTATDRLGALYQRGGDLTQAAELIRAAMEGRKRVLGEAHGHTQASVSNYANILHNMGRHQESLAYLREGLEVATKVNGPDHPDTLMDKCSLAVVLMDVDQFEEARVLLKESSEGLVSALGERHPYSLHVKRTWTKLLLRTGATEEAHREAKQLLEWTTEGDPNRAKSQLLLEQITEALKRSTGGR